MTPYLVAILVTAAVGAVLIGLAPLVSRLKGSPADRVRRRFEAEFGGAGPEEPLAAFKDLRKLAAGAGGGQSVFWQRYAATVEHSGLGVTPERLLWAAAGCGIALAAAGWAVRGPLPAAAGAAVGAAAPLLFARFRAAKRSERLLAQLAEILDLLARFLKAGHSLAQALGAVAGEVKEPARNLFARYQSERDLGLPTEVTLRALADRAGLTEYRIMVMVVLVQQETGGNLAEVCERLAGVVRERFRVRGMIRALTAEGRIQANILMALPPALVLIMLVVNRAYAESMLSQPKLIAGILASQVVGILWIRKIVNVTF